jgi:hypothetical protein
MSLGETRDAWRVGFAREYARLKRAFRIESLLLLITAVTTPYRAHWDCLWYRDLSPTIITSQKLVVICDGKQQYAGNGKANLQPANAHSIPWPQGEHHEHPSNDDCAKYKLLDWRSSPR